MAKRMPPACHRRRRLACPARERRRLPEFAPIDQLVVEERPDPEPGPGQGRGRRAGGGRELRRRPVRAGQVPDQAAAALHAGRWRWPATSWRRRRRRRRGGRRPRAGHAAGSAASRPTSSWPRRDVVPIPAVPSATGRPPRLVQSYGTMLFSFTRRTSAAGGRVGARARRRRRDRAGRRRRARHLGARVIAARLVPGQAGRRRGGGRRGHHRLRDRGPQKAAIRELSGGGVDVVVDPGRRPLRRPGAAGAGLDGPLPRDRLRRRRDPPPARSTRCCSTTAPWSASTGARGRCATRPATSRCSPSSWTWPEPAALHPVEPLAYPLDDVVGALTDLQDRKVAGKVVLVP